MDFISRKALASGSLKITANRTRNAVRSPKDRSVRVARNITAALGGEKRASVKTLLESKRVDIGVLDGKTESDDALGQVGVLLPIDGRIDSVATERL